MIVQELIELLKKMPRDALIVVDSVAVLGIELQTGKVSDGYYNPEFRQNEKGKIKAVRFTKRVELSTGDVVEKAI